MVKKKFISTLTVLIAIVLNSYGQPATYEAENSKLTGTNIASSHKGFSGTGYVTGFDNDGDKAVFTFQIEKEGNYQLYIGYSCPGGNKNNFVYVNGTNQGSILFAAKSTFTELNIGKIWLNKGENTIEIVKEWGWFELDYVRIDNPSENVSWNISKSPVNKNASAEAKKLYSFLVDNFGKTTFAGQFMNEDISYTSENSEISYVEDISGKYPAIYGSDLIDYSPSRVSRGTTSMATDDAIKWYKEEKGIVSLMWHWNAPTDLIDQGDQLWWRGFYTEATTFNIAEVLKDTTSERYSKLISDIDAIAIQLKKIQAENIPVLWRPLHEAEGKWFWWGAKGPDACKKLWILLYKRLTYYHGINNLIWVWTTSDSNVATDWYPGDEYVDILGVDVYLPEGDFGTSSFMFDNLRKIFNGRKLLAMSENGPIPDPEKMYAQEAHWLYFCTWVGDHIKNNKYNPTDHIDEVFNHENITTLDEFNKLWETYNYTNSLKWQSNEIKIYPVPFQNTLRINFSSAYVPEMISLLDINGKTLKSISKEYICMNNIINLENIPKGIYFLHLKDQTGQKYYKVMKN